ncbi:MAG: universal stress protein [Methanosarcinales archaeon]|nr:universal stress protein [Methanosarcinales archaeon]
MFEKVLVPTDFSKYSIKVLECVGGLPGVKKVVLLHVMAPPGDPAMVWDPGARLKEANARLAELKGLLEGQGLDVKTRFEVPSGGEVWKEIQSVADEEQASLMVMGARGKGFVEGILLGNVARKILRYGSTHLLLMRYKILEDVKEGPMEAFCARTFSRVLCPTDFSGPSEEAISFVKGLREVDQIILQHVISRGETSEEIDAHYQDATLKLNAIKEELERGGHEVSSHISVGSSAEKIISLAEKEDVSLVAMSSHGKGWLKQLIVGSTTYDVARLGSRPVLVIRAGKGD